MLKNGASGYLLKDVEPDMLIKAIHIVYEGGAYIYPELEERIFGSLCVEDDINEKAKELWRTGRGERLTARELDVLSCIANLSNDEVFTPPQIANAMLDLRLIFTVGSLESALVLNAIAAERAAMAEVHLKIDTGMGRYGFLPEQVDQAIRVYEYQKNLMVGGIYTHFHSAFCSERATRDQFERFQQVVRQLQAAGYETGVVHCCNSSAFDSLSYCLLLSLRAV